MVGAGEEDVGKELRGIGGGELVRPVDARRGRSAGPGRVGFGVVGGGFVGGVGPITPAGRVDVGGELCINEDHAGVRTPGATEVGGLVSGRIERGGDAGVEDDIAGGLIGRGARLCGDVAGAVGVQLVTLEDGGGVAEDVIDAAFDIAIDVVLATEVGEECVLVAEQTAVPEDGAVGAVALRWPIRPYEAVVEFVAVKAPKSYKDQQGSVATW